MVEYKTVTIYIETEGSTNVYKSDIDASVYTYIYTEDEIEKLENSMSSEHLSKLLREADDEDGYVEIYVLGEEKDNDEQEDKEQEKKDRETAAKIKKDYEHFKTLSFEEKLKSFKDESIKSNGDRHYSDIKFYKVEKKEIKIQI